MEENPTFFDSGEAGEASAGYESNRGYGFGYGNIYGSGTLDGRGFGFGLADDPLQEIDAREEMK